MCSMIKKCRTKLQTEDHAIRTAKPDSMTPANAFETHIGHFWLLPNTRDYMRTRYDLLDTIRQLGTLDGIQEALKHAKDMLQLSTEDIICVRCLVPSLLLQLDQDQECYDFIKWYETKGKGNGLDWGHMDLPFLDIKNADVLEDVGYLNRNYGLIGNITAIILLKLKLLIDVINLKLVRQILTRYLPIDLWREVELAVIRSPLSTKFVKKDTKALTAVSKPLQDQIVRLAAIAEKTNEHFFEGLLHPHEYLKSWPYLYSTGLVEEMQLTLQHNYQSWWQTIGALELLQSAKTIAGKNWVYKIDEAMRGSAFNNRENRDKTREEVLDGVSLKHLWSYLDWAVEDACSLNAERPSNKSTRRD